MGGNLTGSHRVVARCTVGLACMLAAVVVTAPVGAQTQEDDAARTSELFQRGLEYAQAKNWSKALELFREIGRSEPTPEVQYQIARCEENLGNPIAALGGYELALARADRVGEDFKKDIQEKVENLRASIPKLVIKRGNGAEAATIELDGAELGARSIGTEMPIDPGPHTVTAKAPGRTDFTDTISIGETGMQTLVITMAEADPSDDPTGTAHPRDTPVVREPDRTARYIVGGVGAAGLLTAGVFLFMRQYAYNDLEAVCRGDLSRCHLASPEQQEKANEARDRISAYGTVAGLASMVAIGALSASAVMFLSEKSRTAEAGLRLAPAAPGAPAGMSVVGRF